MNAIARRGLAAIARRGLAAVARWGPAAIARWTLVVIAVIGLAIDAYTHFDLAHQFDFNTTGTVNEGVLFRIEAIVAIVAAVLLLIRQNVLTATFTVLVAGGGAALLVLYRYVDVGKIGPIPNMYEPIWFNEKVVSLVGELVALAAALGLLGLLVFSRRTPRHSSRQTVPV